MKKFQCAKKNYLELNYPYSSYIRHNLYSRFKKNFKKKQNNKWFGTCKSEKKLQNTFSQKLIKVKPPPTPNPYQNKVEKVSCRFLIFQMNGIMLC